MLYEVITWYDRGVSRIDTTFPDHPENVALKREAAELLGVPTAPLGAGGMGEVFRATDIRGPMMSSYNFV